MKKHLVFLFLCIVCAYSALADKPLYLLFPDQAKLVPPVTNVKPVSVVNLRCMAPENGAVVPLLSSGQKAYLDLPRDKRVVAFADAAYRQKMRECIYYYQQPVVLVWHNVPDYNRAPQRLVLTIAENPAFNDALAVELPVNAQCLQLFNLKIAQAYYWKVAAIQPDACYETPVSMFTTEDHAPRMLRIDGVPNVRDLGGRIGLNGKRTRQGLIFRTAGLNNNASLRPLPLQEFYRKYPKQKAAIERLDAEIQELKKRAKAPEKAPKYLPWPCKDEWALFMPQKRPNPAQRAQFLQLKEMPASYMGATPVMKKANDKHAIILPDYAQRKVALLAQEFESPEDGVILVTAGADWYWGLSINGQTIFDRMATNLGNAKMVALDNHQFEIPVKKGKNLLTLVLLSGSAGWSWHFYSAQGIVPFKKAMENRIESLKKDREVILNTGAERVPGFNRLYSPNICDYVTMRLGIRSDIDLRSDGECFGMTGSPAGGRVKWFHYSSSAYAGMASEGGKAAFKNVFKVFLDRENYPIAFHCIAGQDRTGAVAFIVSALLGVDEEELYRDWETTGFWNPSANFNHKNLFNHLVKVFDALPGENYTQKAEAYVKSIGFTDADIATLRAIMLE